MSLKIHGGNPVRVRLSPRALRNQASPLQLLPTLIAGVGTERQHLDVRAAQPMQAPLAVLFASLDSSTWPPESTVILK